MIEKLIFEEDYFEAEEREGFWVESMMKRAWAAQLVVLREIDRICRQNNLTYFADSGTLLGAVRHKGFVPWDDDMDIAMKRKDYLKFLKIAERELAEEYHIMSLWTEKEHGTAFARVVNSYEVSYTEERYSKFYGCPYIVGIDIFPLDGIPNNEEERNLLLEIMTILSGALVQCREEGEHLEELLKYIEELLNVKFDREENIERQILILQDRVNQMYGEEEDEITFLPWYLDHRNYHLKREWYDGCVEMPFENISIPVPIGYERVLEALYGDWKKPVRNAQEHEYPFYKKQQEAVERYLNTEEGQRLIKKI